MSELPTTLTYYFPNRLVRILLLAMHETVGKNGVSAVLNTARLQHFLTQLPPPNFEPGLSFDEVGRFFQALEGVYGVRSGRRLSWQMGRSCFKYGMEGLGGVVGVADFALRFLPVSLRVHVGLEVLTEILNRYGDQQIVLGEDEQYYSFIMQRPGLCWNRHTESPACALMVGLLEEMLYWVTRGQRFLVEETTCQACGDPVCTIQISKATMD
ncbi:MAG TPA: 4-vinyl reductase [Anaerolineae bacterium]|nr:4-vinyl reductase [Anaerolineae bacterium]